MAPRGFADLADKPEDERIKIMCEHVLATGETVACAVDDEEEKINRYLRKICNYNKSIRVVDRGKAGGGIYFIKFTADISRN